MRPSSAALAFSAVAACSSQPAAGPACAAAELLVVASDYTATGVGGLPTTTLARGADLGKDPQLAVSNGHAFCLSRDFDNVFEIDGSCGKPTARFSVHDLAPTGRPANPHDAAVAPDGTVFVALYNVGRIALAKDGKLVGNIDISAYDGDGNPQAESIRIVDVGGAAKAFVALERLDDHDFPKSKQPSTMLRIDVASRVVEAAIELVGRNPFNPMAEADGMLFLAEPRDFDAADEEMAGIERFDTRASTSTLLVTERALGGSVADVAVTSGCGAALVAGPQKDVNPTKVVLFDPATGAVLATVLPPTPGYDLQGLAWREGALYVGDRRRGAGGYPVHVFERDGTSCSVHASTREVTLPDLPPVALRAAR